MRYVCKQACHWHLQGTSHHNIQFLPTSHAGNRRVWLKNKVTVHHNIMKLIMPISQHPVRGKQGQDSNPHTNRTSPYKMWKRFCFGRVRPPAVQPALRRWSPGTAGQRPQLQHSHTGGHGLATICFLGINTFPSTAVSPHLSRRLSHFKDSKESPRVIGMNFNITHVKPNMWTETRK